MKGHPAPNGRTTTKGHAGTPKGTNGSRANVATTTSSGGSGQVHVVGFAVNASDASFEAVKSVPHLVSEVAPFWYSVQSSGAVKAMKTPATETWAHKNGVPLMPLFNNANSESAVLTSSSTRQRAVSNIVSIVKQQNYDGASIDFQGLNDTPTVRAGLVSFMSSLASQLHAAGKRVTVNIIPTQSNTGAHGAYNETALAKSADQLILMAYDRHSTGSPPGAVAPLPWVKQGVSSAVAAGVKRSQLLLGVANYGYDWPQGSTNAATVSYAQVTAQIKKTNVKPIWDAASQEYHFTYTKNGATHQVWYEGTRSLAQKVSLAKSEKLSGIAVWRLGYDNAAWWTALGKQVGNKVPKGGTVEGRPMARGSGTGT
jgi:spore germination protein